MKWFGKAGGAPYERDSQHVSTPVGEACGRCGEAIGADDDGVILPLALGRGAVKWRPYHYECQLRGVIGGLNHQMGRCTCCGGTEPPDPEDMTAREAAKAAVSYFQAGRGAK
jgi:hypothetical protein